MDAMENFLAYAGRYDTNDAKIHLKIVHTQAVDAVMERLSEALGLDGRMCGLAHLCAVYHDIGRFEQLRRYDTFLGTSEREPRADGVRGAAQRRISGRTAGKGQADGAESNSQPQPTNGRGRSG